MLPRLVEPELLDKLPPDDPRALQSRRDLQRVNVWMGHDKIMNRILGRVRQRNSPARIIELGAGDGTFLLRVASTSRWRGVQTEAVLVDQQNLVSAQTKAGFTAISWEVLPIQSDVFAWLGKSGLGPADVIIANLFLHHFSNDTLRTLFAYLAGRADFFAACEPRRSRWVLGVSKLLWFIGCNDVSRHDAVASVRAGFTGKDLSALWPPDSAWELTEEPAGSFTHTFVAQRIASASRTF